MKECTEYAALLDLYVDGELSPEDMARVRDHLAGCPACQRYVDDVLAIRAAFPAVEDTDVPEGFAAGVLEAVSAAPQNPAPAKKHQSAVWARVLLPLAACCAIAVLLWGPAFSGGFASSENTTSSAAYDTAAQTESTEVTSEEDVAYSTTAQEPRDSVPETSRTVSTSRSDVESEEAAKDTADFAAAPILTLTAEQAGDLLAACDPVLETETQLQYQLTADQMSSLRAALGITDIGGGTDLEASKDEVFLVVVLK
jgi:hypothetical protein